MFYMFFLKNIFYCKSTACFVLWFRFWHCFWQQRRSMPAFVWWALVMGDCAASVVPASTFMKRAPQLQFWLHLRPRLHQFMPLQINLFKGGNVFNFGVWSFVLEGVGWIKKRSSYPVAKRARRHLLNAH